MIRLKGIIQEIYNSMIGEVSWPETYSQSILTNNPVKLYGVQNYEGTHLEILIRVFPEVLELAQEMGYNDDDEEEAREVLYTVANQFCQEHKIARVVIDHGTFYFNTSRHEPLTNQQMRFVKDYCIEHHLELVHTMGAKKVYIDLTE